MRSEQEIRAKLVKVEQDERLHYKPALVQINAPLALIQVNLRTISDQLRWVLDEPPLPIRGQDEASEEREVRLSPLDVEPENAETLKFECEWARQRRDHRAEYDARLARAAQELLRT